MLTSLIITTLYRRHIALMEYTYTNILLSKPMQKVNTKIELQYQFK